MDTEATADGSKRTRRDGLALAAGGYAAAALVAFLAARGLRVLGYDGAFALAAIASALALFAAAVNALLFSIEAFGGWREHVRAAAASGRAIDAVWIPAAVFGLALPIGALVLVALQVKAWEWDLAIASNADSSTAVLLLALGWFAWNSSRGFLAAPTIAATGAALAVFIVIGLNGWLTEPASGWAASGGGVVLYVVSVGLLAGIYLWRSLVFSRETASIR